MSLGHQAAIAEFYLTDCWYTAAWASDVSRTPLHRVMLDIPIVLFRLEDGAAAALEDVCPHRFAPLSLGKLIGDEIECPHHGLRFDGAGACTLNPHGDGHIPRSATVRSFPLAEKHGAVWIWMGSREKADAALIPADFAILDDPAFIAIRGSLHVEANYQLITDNLLDLSHAQYMHPGLRVANPKRIRHETRQEGDKVVSYFWRDEGEPNALMRLLGWPAGELGDTRAHMHWNAPCLMYLDVGATGVGRPVSEGISAPSVHLLTPETARSTHYLFAFLRNVRTDDGALSERIRALGTQAFAAEDKPIIEAQQRNLRGDHFARLHRGLLAPDAAGTRVRRALQARLDAEMNSEKAEPARAAV